MVIVVGYLRSPEGRAALAAGVKEARLRHAKLVVAHVSALPSENPLEDRSLNHLKSELDATGIDYELRAGFRGMSADVHMVNLAEAVHAGLIVIGVRKRSAVGKVLLGSNAQRILLDASCPVLAVKAS